MMQSRVVTYPGIGKEAYPNGEPQAPSGRTAFPADHIFPRGGLPGRRNRRQIADGGRPATDRGIGASRRCPLAQRRHRGRHPPLRNSPGNQPRPAFLKLPQTSRPRPALRPSHQTHLSRAPPQGRRVGLGPLHISQPLRPFQPLTVYTTMQPSLPEERTPACCGMTARCCARGQSIERPPSHRRPSPWSPSARAPTMPAE